MPRTTTTSRSNPSPYSKPAGGPSSVAAAEQPITLPSQPQLDKALVLRLILAKLEASKTCDWHDLAGKLEAKAKEPTLGPGKGAAGKASRGRKGVKTAKADEKQIGKTWTGTELHDIYHNTILPALKAGRALWQDNVASNEPPTPATTVATLAADETSPSTGGWSKKKPSRLLVTKGSEKGLKARSWDSDDSDEMEEDYESEEYGSDA